jgi:hypothetical protein
VKRSDTFGLSLITFGEEKRNLWSLASPLVMREAGKADQVKPLVKQSEGRGSKKN